MFTGDATDIGPDNLATLKKVLEIFTHDENSTLIVGNRDGNKMRFYDEFMDPEATCTTKIDIPQWKEYKELLEQHCATYLHSFI